MFNFIISNTSCSWTNGSSTSSSSDPNIVSDQTSPNNPNNLCPKNTPNSKQQHDIPQGIADDHASPFSMVCFPPPLTPLFEDQTTITQHFQLPHQNNTGLVSNHNDPQAAFSMIIADQLTGKAVPTNPTTDDDDHELITPMAEELGSRSERKIATSTRPRHRRMRLSIDIARQFFDLQDMLGFERASKTVEWLLVHARSHIRNLRKESCPNSSDCKVISGIDHEEEDIGVTSKPCGKTKRKYHRRIRSSTQALRRSAFDPAAKRVREMARQKARERTREKQLAQAVPMDPPLMNVQHFQDHDTTMGSVMNCSQLRLENNQNGLINEDHSSLDNHFYGDDLVGAEGNNHLAMIYEDMYYSFNNDSLQNDSTYTVLGSGIPQDQHRRLDYQFVAKTWNMHACMSSHNQS